MAASGPSAIRHFGKAIACREQPGRDLLGRGWIELPDIGPDSLEIADSRSSPDYSPHLGGGSSFCVPQD